MDYKIAEESTIEQVKHRSVTGVIALFLRTGLLQVIAIAATFLLTVFLDPVHFGIFGITAAAVDILVYFSDIGLAAALIQKKKLDKDDLSTTFTIQQLLSLLLVTAGFLLTGVVGRLYSLSNAGVWLFRALLISFFLSTLKTIPSIRLERRLDFGKLVIPQIIENLAFYAAAVILAWRGFGITSFTLAILIRSILGLIAIYIVSPWKPSLSFNKHSFKTLVSFGVPFQLNSILALVKDRLLVAYYGIVLPAAQVGYLQWAERWSLFPHRIVVDNVNKVTFPAYSRLQGKTIELTKAIEKSIFFTTLIIFPILIGMNVLAPALIQIIPKYQKWQPALLALMLFSINGMWSSISTTLTNSFAAMGKIKINLKLMVMWTTLTWILTPLLIWKFGYNGVAAASALVATTSIIPMIIIKRLLPVKLAQNILPALFSSALMGFALYFLSFFPASPAGGLLPSSFFLLAIPAGVILYFTCLFLLTGKKLINEFRSIKQLAV